MPFITLGDRRALAFEDRGDRDGRPGSRLFSPDPAATEAAGVRLLTFDRPGYGRSDPQAHRRVANAASDVVALLDHLGLTSAANVVWSRGGPFAVATAKHAPTRGTRLALVSAPGPLDEVPGGWEALGDYQRPTAETARREPHRSVRAIARHMTPYLADPPSFLGRGRGPDGDVMRGPARTMLVAQVTEALTQGAGGMASDLVAMWRSWRQYRTTGDWGFRLSAIEIATTVFAGAHDPHNQSDARCYAARIPGANLVVWQEAGHLGIVANWADVLAATA